MADAFRLQETDSTMSEAPFEDRFGLLVDAEYTHRKNNRLKRLIRNAAFDQPEASIADINYVSGRKLNKELINRLATCEYIIDYRNIFITGATGSGKSYLLPVLSEWKPVNIITAPDMCVFLTCLLILRMHVQTVIIKRQCQSMRLRFF